MASRVGHGAGLLMAACGTAIIVSSLTLGVAASLFRQRPDLTEYRVAIVGVTWNDAYYLHVTGAGGIDRWYNVWLPPAFEMPDDPGFAPSEKPGNFVLSIPNSSSIDVLTQQCDLLGSVVGPWGPQPRSLSLHPVGAGTVRATPKDNDIGSMDGPPCTGSI